MEPPQAYSGEKLRPDILIHFANRDSYRVAYDLTLVNQEFLARYEGTKNNKYQSKCEQDGVSFCLIVLSAFGGVHNIGYEAGIKYMISKTKYKGFKSPNWAAPNRHTYWLQRIAIALWAGNVKKVVPFPLSQLSNKQIKYTFIHHTKHNTLTRFARKK